MKLFDCTLPTPAENLALDESLLEMAEASEADPDDSSYGDVLRLWEPDQPFVVLGRASRHTQEVNLAACRNANIPIFRRVSGGATIITGPGCLMYSVVLGYRGREYLRGIDAAHRFVLGRIAAAIAMHVPGVRHAGISDLVIGNAPPRKFSGNSLRCKRTHLLYHGTLMYDFDLSLISTCLRMPPRQPDYRNGRSHEQFVTSLLLDVDTLHDVMRQAWEVAQDDVAMQPPLAMKGLINRHRSAAWIFER